MKTNPGEPTGKRQVEEVMETLSEGPEGLYKRPGATRG